MSEKVLSYERDDEELCSLCSRKAAGTLYLPSVGKELEFCKYHHRKMLWLSHGWDRGK